MAFVTRPDGTVIHYEDCNSAHSQKRPGNPVVFVHGLGCNWRIWTKQIDRLAPYCRVVTVDNRGSGPSHPGAQGWSTKDMAADLRAVVEDAKLVAPVLVGLSMGGTICLQYALDYPNALQQLVIVNAPGGFPRPVRWLQRKELHAIDTVSISETARRRMRKEFSARSSPDLEKWMVAMISEMNVDNYRSQANATYAFNAWSHLHEIRVTTTIISGSQDAIVPAYFSRAMHWAIPHSTFRILKGYGHFANLEAPEAFNAVLAEVIGLTVSCDTTAILRRALSIG